MSLLNSVYSDLWFQILSFTTLVINIYTNMLIQKQVQTLTEVGCIMLSTYFLSGYLYFGA